MLALYWKCVHLGCTVPWNAGRSEFICPCHGSVYNPNGVRIAGPAPRPLDYMGVTVDRAATSPSTPATSAPGADYSPDQATPYTA